MSTFLGGGVEIEMRRFAVDAAGRRWCQNVGTLRPFKMDLVSDQPYYGGYYSYGSGLELTIEVTADEMSALNPYVSSGEPVQLKISGISPRDKFIVLDGKFIMTRSDAHGRGEAVFVGRPGNTGESSGGALTIQAQSATERLVTGFGTKKRRRDGLPDWRRP